MAAKTLRTKFNTDEVCWTAVAVCGTLRCTGFEGQRGGLNGGLVGQDAVLGVVSVATHDGLNFAKFSGRCEGNYSGEQEQSKGGMRHTLCVGYELFRSTRSTAAADFHSQGGSVVVWCGGL